MKKVILLFVALIGSSVAMAQVKTEVNSAQTHQPKQQQASKEERAEQFAGRMLKELNLTPEQKNRVYAAKLDQITAKEGLDAQYTDKEAQRAHHAEYSAVQESFDAKMKTILTADQYQKWQEKKRNNKVVGPAPKKK
ncbi:MAG: DUF4890 domain-containing protein [Flavobacteriales bacterium]|nr:DUF4890 domain-containing protein [Flavobacteriales bacterium]